MRRWGLLLPILCLLGGATARAAAPQDALARRSFTVIAVVDSGINPYHAAFQRKDMRAHPSTYVSGYPRSATALNLSIGSDDLDDARARDARAWQAVKPRQLYWIPGTNIVGAIGPFGSGGTPIWDDNGHGTATSSLAGTPTYGPDTHDVLIVLVQGFDAQALAWAASQPWIDVVTNSWGPLLGVGLDNDAIADASYAAVDAGKVVCFATGNFANPGLHDPTAGPSWIVNVGAASESNRGEHAYTAWPNDVLGYSNVAFADHESIADEAKDIGTSFSAPAVCGLMAKALADLRRAVGDRREGPRAGSLVTGRRSRGPLSDGVLTRRELEDAFHATAVPAETVMVPDTSDPYAVPAVPGLATVRDGYGIVDAASAAAAYQVLLGARTRPDRQIEDAWFGVSERAREAIWGPAPD